MTSTYRSDPATEPVRIVGYSKPRTRTSDDVTDHRRQNVAAGRPDRTPTPACGTWTSSSRDATTGRAETTDRPAARRIEGRGGLRSTCSRPARWATGAASDRLSGGAACWAAGQSNGRERRGRRG